MNVSLTPQLESMIREKVDSGRYNNASEVVRQALRLLELEEQNTAWLRRQIMVGIEQIERGEVIEVDDEYWDKVDREVDERIARGETAVIGGWS